MSITASCQSQIDRAGPVVGAFGLAAMTAVPILAAISVGLVDVGRHNIVVSVAAHRRSRWLLYALALVAGIWVSLDTLRALGLNEHVCMAKAYIVGATAQGACALAALALLVMSLRHLSSLAEDSND